MLVYPDTVLIQIFLMFITLVASDTKDMPYGLGIVRDCWQNHVIVVNL